MKTNLKVIATEVQAQVATKVKLVTDKYEASKLRLKSRVERKLEDVAVNVMGWMLGSPRVQRVVAKQLQNNAGALCRVLDEAIENGIEGATIEVDADDVRGLESAIESAMENNPVKARDVEDLDDEVQNIVSEMDLEVKAENIQGLDSAISEAFDEAEFEAHQVRGLDKAVESAVEQLLTDEIAEAIGNKVIAEIVSRLNQ